MKDVRMNDVKDAVVQRRRFLTGAGGAGLAAAAGLLLPGKGSRAYAEGLEYDNQGQDTAKEIFTAALIAEDLATTFYYNGLVGKVIEDPNLAGTGGTATKIAADGNAGNVAYIRAALSEEIAHANLLRSLLEGKAASGDPVQTFYLPTGTFDTIGAFTSVLNALEEAFIGAYLTAVYEFAAMAADSLSGANRQKSVSGAYYTSRDLEYFAQVSAAIMGIEAEHRVLGRVISNTNPANQLNYEQVDGIQYVYHGTKSAVAALTPFLGPSEGMTAYSFEEALKGAPSIVLPTSGGLPPAPPARHDGK